MRKIHSQSHDRRRSAAQTLTIRSNLPLLVPILALLTCAYSSALLSPFPAFAAKQTAHRSGKDSKSRYALRITVKNPRCPACLKTLKTYLLEIRGVKSVWVHPMGARDLKAVITVTLDKRSLSPRVIERIKAHDLQILNVSY